MPPTHDRLELVLRACATANLAALIAAAVAGAPSPLGEALLGSGWVWLGAHGACRLAMGQLRGLLSVALAAELWLTLLHHAAGTSAQGVSEVVLSSPAGGPLLGAVVVLGILDGLQRARSAFHAPLGAVRPRRAHAPHLSALGQAGAVGGAVARGVLGALVLVGILDGADALGPGLMRIARDGVGGLLMGCIAAGLLAQAAHLLALGAYRQVPLSQPMNG